MDYAITQESFASLTSYWTNSSHNLRWNSIFILPGWLETWWQAFGGGAELYLRAVRQGEKVIGIAPMLIRGEAASIIGGANVCDYLDFVVAPGMEGEFFGVLLDDLRQKGIGYLDLRPLRHDSTVLTHLAGIARNRGYEVFCHEERVSVELNLPLTWDGYLLMLAKKQRHEVRRKLRRLWESGNADYHCLEASQEVEDFMGTFLKLFPLSREEKANFMTAQMESFFRSLAEAMAKIGLLRFGILRLNSMPASIVMTFDYRDSVYLYNSAYDPNYSQLSVGMLCKVLCIKESIQRGKKRFDFLQGAEPYKYHLGGKETPLYSCQITAK